MPFIETAFPGLLVFEPKIFGDDRGYFFESYSERIFSERGIQLKFVQDNESFSAYGVIRGLHYQLQPYEQVKLIRVIQGTILDVVVDVRKGSPTYGKSFTVELTGDNKKQLFIPAGFAHGFSVLSEKALVLYKCNKFYKKEAEGGICYNDPQLNIDWKIPADKAIISDKDKILPVFTECNANFHFQG